MRLKEQEQLFEDDRKLKPALRALKGDEHFTKEEVRATMFRRWLEENGLRTGAISGASEKIDWLCCISISSGRLA